MGSYQQWFARRVSQDPSASDPAIVAHKKALFRTLNGNVLEIGSGTGSNFRFFPKKITWIGLEPNPYMKEYLQNKSQVIQGFAEQIPFPDNTFHCVISTHVLCSVDDVPQVLREVYRVLKPKGRFYFLEHVRSPFLWRRLCQQVVAPVWQLVADGCHPDRDILSHLYHAPFSKISHQRFRASLPVVSDHISGTARK